MRYICLTCRKEVSYNAEAFEKNALKCDSCKNSTFLKSFQTKTSFCQL